MRILSYNIYNCFRDSQAFDRLAQMLVALDVDTLLVNEYQANEDGRRLQEALAAAGFTSSEVGRSANRHGHNTNCNAIFSRRPFEVVANEESLRFMAVHQDGRTLAAYHASPRGVAEVLPEVQAVRAFVAERRDVLLAGDMNSLARADQRVLDYAADGEALDRYMQDGALSFEAIDRLLEAGLVDLNVDAERFTVPTAVGRKAEAGCSLRLDYAFGKGVCAAECEAEVLREPPFDVMSDHYPVLVRG